MVEKEVKTPHPKTVGMGVVKKVIPLDLRLRHTRKAAEFNLAKNCKKTTSKKLTKGQSDYYNQVLEQQREKEEIRMKKGKKGKMRVENLI